MVADEQFRIIDFDERTSMKLGRAVPGRMEGKTIKGLLMPGHWENYLRKNSPGKLKKKEPGSALTPFYKNNFP